MPTYGSNYEDHRDHQLGDGDALPNRPGPPAFSCPICDSTAPSSLRLAAHIADEHPLTQPKLVISGTFVAASHTVWTRLDPSDVKVVGANRLELVEGGDAREISESELGQLISSGGERRLRIRLHHDRGEDDAHAYDEAEVCVVVPEVGDLNRADDEFTAHLAEDSLTREGLAAYDAATRDLDTGRAYASALYDFCVAVRLRDGDALLVEGADPTAARAKLQRALEALRHYSGRPLPRAVTAFARFMLNDFRSWEASGVERLDGCGGALAAAAGVEPPEPIIVGAHESARCPVDRRTAELVDTWSLDRPDPACFLAIAQSDEPCLEDRVKAAALALLAADGKQADLGLERAARSLTNDIEFGSWAEDWIARNGVSV